MQQKNEALSADQRSERREQVVLWGAMIIGILMAGLAFVYKVAEFLFTLGSDDVQGFADVPVAVYFTVATGWLFLLVWCYRTGKFNGVEESKWDMLRQEDEYERLGE